MDIVKASLTSIGVTYYEITRDLLNVPETKPGRRGHWEWRVLGTGKVVAVEKQDDVPWRTLA
jgi:hypothetical protein